ncbi:MAG: 2-oxo acid dehydrogenase subunit E2 [Bacteroidales bacterium]|nr:2-oxo acid dehydrogenase subunit E2 [Bacteroidales bacterium]
MSKFELIMPKMGESVQEATITKWFKKTGDKVEEDEPVLEIATDKVDTEVPSPVEGIVEKVLFKENDVVAVGKVIAVINTEGDATADQAAESDAAGNETEEPSESPDTAEVKEEKSPAKKDYSKASKFYSPLVRSMAEKEKIPLAELEKIEGTGINGRVRKQDILAYIEKKQSGKPVQEKEPSVSAPQPPRVGVQVKPGDEIIEMDRMRRLIADHMVMSKRVSPHVSNFIEADVTSLSIWRDKVKDDFYSREKIKLTFMPVFIEAAAKALKEFPGVNASVDGYKIILRKNINIAIAVALPSGNLIVPVIKNADQKNLLGIAGELNRIAEAARNNKLSPDDIQEGTFTISNFGTFRNLTGTPVINQPQVAILATGTIEKKPAVLETPTGDVIAIRHKMILSLSYDHRAVDGALAGAFLYRLKELLENFDMNRTI